LGFKANIHGRSLLEIARQTLMLSEQGLARRKKLGHGGKDETMYLRPLQEIAERGITPAEELLEKFHDAWNGSVEPIFDEYAY
jgi:glutamate--cysteine ligase